MHRRHPPRNASCKLESGLWGGLGFWPGGPDMCHVLESGPACGGPFPVLRGPRGRRNGRAAQPSPTRSSSCLLCLGPSSDLRAQGCGPHQRPGPSPFRPGSTPNTMTWLISKGMGIPVSWTRPSPSSTRRSPPDGPGSPLPPNASGALFFFFSPSRRGDECWVIVTSSPFHP